MQFLRRHRPSGLYLILFPCVLIISLIVTFYEHKIFKIEKNLTIISLKSSNAYLRVQIDWKTTSAKCQPLDNLIVYILSNVMNFERRKLIRSTWATPIEGTCYIFIVGTISEHQSTQLLLNNEKQQYHDIVQIVHNESYANVIYKELAALEWTRQFYPFIPYLFKTDDDLIVDSILLSNIAEILVTNVNNDTSYISRNRPQLVSHLFLSDRRTFFQGGWSMDFQPTLRSSKFAISESVWPEPILPLYCSGFGWLMSKHVRDKLVQTSRTYSLSKVAWIGDVFISGFLAKAANVKCTGIALDYEQTSSANCSCLFAQKPMLTVCSSTFHGGVAGDEKLKNLEYVKAWNVIRKRHRSELNQADC